MKVAVAFDHRGVELREAVLEAVAQAGCEAIDLGVKDASVRVDYPDQASDVGKRIRAAQAERGILVCGSGVGACVAARTSMPQRVRLSSSHNMPRTAGATTIKNRS